jgi:hypothetical protein
MKQRPRQITYDPKFALRALMPRTHGFDHAEGLHLAAVQATALLGIAEVSGPPVPVLAAAQHLDVVTEYDPAAGVIGCHEARGDTWYIRYGDATPAGRDATVAHQLKRILDEPFGDGLYPPVEAMPTLVRQHYVAEYFTLCLTMPVPWVEAAWRCGEHEHDVERMAKLFATTPASMLFRLKALGLVEPGYRL